SSVQKICRLQRGHSITAIGYSDRSFVQRVVRILKRIRTSGCAPGGLRPALHAGTGRRAPDRRQIQPEESGLPHRASTWRHGRGTLLPFRLCQSKTELRMSQAVCRSQERHHYTRGGRSKRGEPMRFEDMFAKTIVLAVAALLAGSAILQAQSKTDVTGKWALE